MKDSKSVNVRNIPLEVHSKFKAKAASKGQGIEERALELIRKDVEKNVDSNK